jgi:Flp pilus assembly protein TadG
MLTAFRAFLKDRSGQISIIFALMSVPLMLAVGAAIDRIRMDNVRTEMQSAIDAASLAAAMAETKTNPQRITIAKQYFNDNFVPANGGLVKLDVKVNAKTISASASYDMPTSLMQLAGLDVSNITVTSEVMRAALTTVEIALVLDYSGSMNDNSKFSRMAKAAGEMVNQLYSKVASGRLKIGVVPFSAMVYTSMPSSYVTQWSWSSTWTGCTQDRAYPNNLGVTTPSSDASTKWGYYDPTGENDGIYACSTYSSNDLMILPLTTDINAVQSKLTAMSPVGNTNIPLGAEFGWNVLDPAAPYTEGNPYTDKQTQKHLILLTDGMQTSMQSGADGTRSVANGNDNLVQLCKNISKSGIEVFTIAYDITDPGIKKLLKDCAGNNYYEPDAIGTEINTVFQSIAKKIETRMVHISR